MIGAANGVKSDAARGNGRRDALLLGKRGGVTTGRKAIKICTRVPHSDAAARRRVAQIAETALGWA